MVTKFHIHKMRTGVSGFLMLGCASIVHHSWSCLTTIKTVSMTLDANIAPARAAEIQKKLTDELKQKTPSNTLFSTMRAHFCCIDTIESHIYAPGCVHYTIVALLPRFAINKDFVLCDNNQLVPRSWYNELLYAQLPEITTTRPLQAGVAPAGLCLVARMLPQAIVHHYDVVWHDDTQTTLTHKYFTNFTITCNATCIADMHIYKTCENIYMALKQHPSCAKTSSGALHADIRFANQIVIHADQGRTIHG